MRTAKELGACIGEVRYVNVDGMELPVTLIDAKEAYGNVRYLVSPVGGFGSAWKDEGSLATKA